MKHSFGTLELLHKEMANLSNEQKRHCRIGKVIPKISPFPLSPPTVPKLTLPKMWPFYDHAGAPSPQYMDKCGCKVGTACGNVACPHRLISTCAS